MVNDSSCCLGNEPVNTLIRTVQATLNLEHPSALYGTCPSGFYKCLEKTLKYPIFFSIWRWYNCSKDGTYKDHANSFSLFLVRLL